MRRIVLGDLSERGATGRPGRRLEASNGDKERAGLYWNVPLFVRRNPNVMLPGEFEIRVPLFCDEIELRPRGRLERG